MTSRHIEMSPFQTLPVVTFVNRGRPVPSREVHVCTSARVAELVAIRLRRMKHIHDVEILDACVKGEDAPDVAPDTQPRHTPVPRASFGKMERSYREDDGEQDVFLGDVCVGTITSVVTSAGWMDNEVTVTDYTVALGLYGIEYELDLTVKHFANARAAHTAAKNWVRGLVSAYAEGVARGERFFNAELREG